MSTPPRLEELLVRGRRYLARKRRSVSVRALHRLASYIEDAYENAEWDMCANGETSLMERLEPAGFRTVFDVGAHVGDWTIEALRLWPRAHVHAFEVAAPTFERLRAHVGAAGFTARTTLNQAGLGEVTGGREMFYFPDHPHLTCDIARHQFPATRFAARLIAGDEYLERQGLASIDFAKIDVEGAEHLVLKGLRSALDSGRIACIQFEYGAFSVQTRVLLADYYALLSSNYWIGKVFPTHVEFRDYDWTMESFRFANFLCVNRGRPDLLAMAAASGAPARAVQRDVALAH